MLRRVIFPSRRAFLTVEKHIRSYTAVADVSSTAAASRSNTADAVDSRQPAGRLTYDASKAGLQKVNKTHVQQVITAASRNSAFYKSEQRKEAERTVRHAALVAKQHVFHHLPNAEQQKWAAKAETVQAGLEATRDFTRRFIHIDLDMFYAAVEEKFNPSLRNRPFAVGSFAMLTTSNYIARQYGVRSGMPGFIAKKLCPKLWIQPVHFDLYRAEAAAVRAIAAAYDPNYVTVGLDELTMDVTAYLERHNGKRKDGDVVLTAEAVCAEFRARVEAATQLTCSGGVSHTAAFAKLASNVNKPNGQHTVTLHTREAVLQHVREMPVRDIPGVGAATEHQLQALGIKTCGDFLTHKAELCYLFREKTFAFYLSAGLGVVRTHVDRTIAERAAQSLLGSTAVALDTSAPAKTKSTRSRKAKADRKGERAAPVQTPNSLSQKYLQKSTGKSRTFSRGLPSPAAFHMRLRELVSGAHAVLVQQGGGTRHVSFITCDHNFDWHTYSTTLPSVTADSAQLLRAVTKLAEPFTARHREFRLIGVNFKQLQRMPEGVPGTLTKSARTSLTTSVEAPTKVSHRYPKRRPSPSQPASKALHTVATRRKEENNIGCKTAMKHLSSSTKGGLAMKRQRKIVAPRRKLATSTRRAKGTSVIDVCVL